MQRAGRKSALATVIAVMMMMAGGFSVSAAFAQGAEDDPAQVEAGMAVYESNCAGCHGADGAGTDRGRPLTGIAAQEADRAVHIASVTDGKGGMPAFGENLTADEIDAAISYVRLSFAGDTAAEPEPEATAPEPVEELPNTGAATTPLALLGATLLIAGLALVTFDLKRTTRS